MKEDFNKKMSKKIRTDYIKNLVFDNTKTFTQVYSIFEHCVHYQFRNDVVDKYIVYSKNIKQKSNSKINNKYQESKYIKMNKITEKLKSLTVFKFLLFGGAMLDHRTVYHYTNAEAWAEIGDMIQERHGNYYSAIAYFDNDINSALKQLEKFLIKPITNKVSAASVFDFIPDYKIEQCNCQTIERKKKLKNIKNTTN